MQPGVPNKPMPQQPQPPFGGGSSSGRGCGCIAFGCGGVLLGMIGLCVVLYYTLFFSNLPLVMIKQALEESGNVKIDGLKGNFSSGFEMKAIRFKEPKQKGEGKDEGKWSELNEIRVKYRNGGMFGNSFTVEDISIAGGTIYSDLNVNGELSGDLFFNEIQEEFSDFQADFSGNSRGTLEIKNISFRNLKICDPKTKEEFHIDDISLKDVLIEDGELVEFGDLVVKADSVELETIRSNGIADAKLQRTVKGRLQKGILSNVLTDLPFEIEFGVLDDGKIASRSRWFDGKILSVAGFQQEPNRYQMTGFSPGQYLRIRDTGVLPTDINLDVTYDGKKRQQLASVDSKGYVMLGAARLENFRLPEATEGSASPKFILASTEVDGQQIEAELYLLSQFPLLGVKLRKAADWSLEDTWARTVFGQAYGDLTDPQREELQVSISLAERRFKGGKPQADAKPKRDGDQPSNNEGEEEKESGSQESRGNDPDLGESESSGKLDQPTESESLLEETPAEEKGGQPNKPAEDKDGDGLSFSDNCLSLAC